MQTILGTVIIAFLYEVLAILIIYKYDSKKALKGESIIGLIIYPNYFIVFFLPFTIPMLFSGVLTRFVNPWQLGIFINFLLSSFSFIILIKISFKRYYFTEKGVEILNIITSKSKIIPLKNIEKVVFKRYNDEAQYIIQCKNQNIKFSSIQLPSHEGFIRYLRSVGIPYYEYNIYTDTYTKSKNS